MYVGTDTSEYNQLLLTGICFHMVWLVLVGCIHVWLSTPPLQIKKLDLESPIIYLYFEYSLKEKQEKQRKRSIPADKHSPTLTRANYRQLR